MNTKTDYTMKGQVLRYMQEAVAKNSEVTAVSIINHKTGEDVPHKAIVSYVSQLNKSQFASLNFYTKTGANRQRILGFYGCQKLPQF